MIIVLLGCFLGFVMGVLEVDPDGFGEWVFAVFLGLLFAAIGFFFSALVVLGIGYFPKQVRVQETRYELAALQDGGATQGHFFLGTGYINEKLTYSFYRREGDAYRGAQKDAENVLVYEDEQSNPYIVEYFSEFVNKIWYLFAVPGKEYDSEIHIPKGSIKQGFVLDLKN